MKSFTSIFSNFFSIFIGSYASGTLMTRDVYQTLKMMQLLTWKVIITFVYSFIFIFDTAHSSSENLKKDFEFMYIHSLKGELRVTAC